MTVKYIKANGKYKANNDDTIMDFYLKFREEIMLPFSKIGKNTLPPYLQGNREESMIIQSYGKETLANLYCKMMIEYIHNTLIPDLVKKEVTMKV